LAGAVEVLDRRAAQAAVDPVVAGTELEPRQRGVSGDSVDRPGETVDVDTALEQHELPAGEDPDRLAFELHAILLAADTKFVLYDDPAVLDLARQVVHQRLGLDNGGVRPAA
jgi:tetracycline repressor-like protein